MAEDFPLDEDGYDDLSEPEFPLPDGVSKEILTEAGTSQWLKPKVGDEVTIHYVAKHSVTNPPEFREFYSSRSGEPFCFTLGQGQVAKGLELGIPTMRRGELAQFTMTGDFGAMEGPMEAMEGSKFSVPEGATFLYEVELISWKARSDLLKDGSVIKTTMEEGTGWKTPQLKEEVCLGLRILAPDKAVLKEVDDLEYTLGSMNFGDASAVVDRCLVGMKKKEVALLECQRELDFGDGIKMSDLAVTITLKEIYETKDVSFQKDKSLIKKQIVEGQGYETPKDGSSVHLAIEAAAAEAWKNLSFQKRLLDFVSGDGQVPDALEFAAMDMKKGEKAVLKVKCPDGSLRAQLDLPDDLPEVFLTLSLESFEQAPALGMDEGQQKVERASARKEVGTRHFKAGRWAMAVLRYKSVTELLTYVEHFDDEVRGKAKELKFTCELNKAACFLKLQMFAEAKVACRLVLEEPSCRNVKALFRRAQAEMGLKNFTECISDCKKVLQLDEENRDAKVLLRQAVAAQKEADKKSKAVFASMCKALGKDGNETQEPVSKHEPVIIQEKGPADGPGIVATLFQGVSWAFLFFPNLVFSNFSYFFGFFWQRLTGKTQNGAG